MTKRDARQVAWTCAATVALAMGCGGDGLSTAQKLAWGASLPSQRIPSTVTSVAVRGDYLDTLVESDVFRLRFLLPDREACRAVAEHGAQVTFVRLRLFGLLRRGEATCEPMGVASLAEWRDLRSRPRRFEPVPRAQAVFHVTWTDEDVVLARGRFPLASEIGFTGTDDLVAMLPNGPECVDRLQQGVASMEFRDAGRVAFALVGSEGLCPILGFAIPIPDEAGPTDEAEPA